MATVPAPRRTAPTPAAGTDTLTIVTDRFSLEIPPAVHTMQGFREWATQDDFPERVRVTYIQGKVILDMSNEELNAHV